MRNTENQLSNFDFEAYLAECSTPEFEEEARLEAEMAEQNRYAKMMDRYSMEVKDHTELSTCSRCSGKGTLCIVRIINEKT